MAKGKSKPPATNATDRAREAFIAIFSETCNVSEGARAAGVDRSTVYRWREADPRFAAAWDEAEQVAIDSLEKVAWDRAKGGVSDRMLEILLKAHRPDKFKDRVAAEISGKIGITITSDDAAL